MRSNSTSVTLILALALVGCAPQLQLQEAQKNVPATFRGNSDTTTVALTSWREYFADPQLVALIDTALNSNQELNIAQQRIAIAQNEVREKKGEYLPFIGLRAASEVEKVGEFTRNGAVEHNLEIEHGKAFPEPLPNHSLDAYATWEVDIWKKLRNAKKAAVYEYLASVEGRNLLVTELVAEITTSYYELLALDNLLQIVDNNIAIQFNALEVVKQQKLSAKVTQLAVNRFHAQLLNTQNLRFGIRQQITETENRIAFLSGSYPQALQRNSSGFAQLTVNDVPTGIPSQLLQYRPDIRRAEMELNKARLDVKVAKARFYPSLEIKAGVGYEAFNLEYLLDPQSLLYNLAGDLVAPLVNRSAIKAAYRTAGARQVQAAYEYEQSLINAYTDVLNQLAKLENYSAGHDTKAQEVDILAKSVQIANNLFNSARADYSEVLLTQEEALESRMELTEIKLQQLEAKVGLYRALGGGWR